MDWTVPSLAGVGTAQAPSIMIDIPGDLDLTMVILFRLRRRRHAA